MQCLSNVIKNNPFCTSPEKILLKDRKFDNHWVGHSVMKSVDAELFQIIKYIKEADDEKYYNFDMDILKEFAKEKSLSV